jgi:transcriptional antiterminator RfaH
VTEWCVVYTQPHAEARAAEQLRRQGYEAYLPRYRTWIRHARRRQMVLRPLFPRYLFAGLDRSVMRWRPIASTAGVADIVRVGDEPAPVPAGIIAAIREREAGGDFDRTDPRCELRLGERVRVTQGAFTEMVGRLVELRDQDRIVVLLEWLGRTVRTQLHAEAVVAA